TPITFLALAGALRPAVELMYRAAWPGLLAGLGIVMAAPLWLSLRPSLAPLVTSGVIWSVAALLCGLLFANSFFCRRWLAVGCALSVAVAGGLDACNSPKEFEGRGFPNRDIHLALAQSHQYLRDIWPTQAYRFWYPHDDPLAKDEVYYS